MQPLAILMHKWMTVQLESLRPLQEVFVYSKQRNETTCSAMQQPKQI
jgi:hypothetical protein